MGEHEHAAYSRRGYALTLTHIATLAVRTDTQNDATRHLWPFIHTCSTGKRVFTIKKNAAQSNAKPPQTKTGRGTDPGDRACDEHESNVRCEWIEAYEIHEWLRGRSTTRVAR